MPASGIDIRFLGIRPLYDQGVIARFEAVLPEGCTGAPELSGTIASIVRRPVAECLQIGERPGEDGTRIVTVSLRNRTYRWGFRLTVRASREDGSRLRAARTVSFDECRASEQAWLEERRNVQNDERYDAWFRAQRTCEAELDRQCREAGKLERQPLVSIVTPVYRPPASYLREMVDSVLGQTYPKLELILANASGECAEVDDVLAEAARDERVRIIEIENRSIAENTNAALAEATGDYVAFVDHDDLLEPDALFRYVEAICAAPEADLLFCDEDMWGVPDDEAGDDAASERFFGPKFKPSWNPSRLLDGNIVCHMLMVSRRVLEQVEPTPAELTGAQDYDLTLKAAELAREIVHVPRMLYHWRSYPSSSATNLESKPYLLEAGRLAVQAHFDRVGIDARVGTGSYPLTYRTRFGGVGERRVCRLSLEEALHGASDGQLDALGDADVVLLAAEDAVLDEGCADELVGVLARDEVAIAAPITLDADGLVSSAGLTIRADGVRTPMSAGLAWMDVGYSQFLCCNHDVSAVAASCLALRADVFRELGGLDLAFADDAEAAVVDLCLRAGERGRFCCVVATAHVRVPARADHASHADDLLARHPSIAEGDPFLGACLDPSSPFYQLSS